MSKPHLEYLRHILIVINFIVEQSHGLEQGEFLSDEVMKRAIVRSIEIIGEAVKRLPVELREQHSEIDTVNFPDKLLAYVHSRSSQKT